MSRVRKKRKNLSFSKNGLVFLHFKTKFGPVSLETQIHLNVQTKV